MPLTDQIISITGDAYFPSCPSNFTHAVFDLVVGNKAQAATTTAVQQSNAL